MSAQYRPFLALVAPGGRILDLGSGAGNASLYFTRAGYRVLAVDACAELLEHTRERVGCEVRRLRFEDLDYTDAFDGVWACASLLHVPKAGLPGMFRLVRRALKKGGVFYASFKYGDAERVKNGRAFTDLNEDSLRSLLEEAGGFRIAEVTAFESGLVIRFSQRIHRFARHCFNEVRNVFNVLAGRGDREHRGRRAVTVAPPNW